MKKLLCMLVLGSLIFAGIHEVNQRAKTKIQESLFRYNSYVRVYYEGWSIDGHTILPNATQQESLKTWANIEIDIIKLYADSLGHYGE